MKEFVAELIHRRDRAACVAQFWRMRVNYEVMQ